MQLPNLLLPDQAGENNRRLCYPGHRLDDVIVNPIARLKPHTVAIENIGKTNAIIDRERHTEEQKKRH